MGNQANWVSLAVAVVTALSVLTGKLLSNRAQRRTDKTEEGLAALEWAKEFEGRTQRAEAKATAAEEKNTENARRQIELERKIAKNEEAADALVEMFEWTGRVITLAHDATDIDHVQLLRAINGGPPAYRRNRA